MLMQNRRSALAWITTCIASLPGRASAQDHAAADGGSLYGDVRTYDELGVHRTATEGDAACSIWLQRRLAKLGFSVTLQPFAAPLFRPGVCQIALTDRGADEAAVAAFPAWPVVTTPAKGLLGILSDKGAGLLDGLIALASAPYATGAAWALPRFNAPVRACIERGARAVVLVTEGPTGGVIALNVTPGKFDWPVPVVLAGGAQGARLEAIAMSGAEVRLTSTGSFNSSAEATNVIAHRPGRGPTIVVSTPKSGWFHCAGERGSGIAVFLALADWLARSTVRDLVFVANSGHELGETGASHFLETAAPPPETVSVWLHIGADVAVQGVVGPVGRLTGDRSAVETRGVAVSANLDALARRAFVGLAGYETPKVFTAAAAPGELEIVRKAGYATLAGMVGAGPLFHTIFDRASIATTPAILEPVARAAKALLANFI